MQLASAAAGSSATDNLLGPYEAWLFDAGKYFDLPGLLLDRAHSLSCVAEFAAPVGPAALSRHSAMTTDDGTELSVDLPDLCALTPTRFIPFVLTARRNGRPRDLLHDLSAREVRDLLARFVAAAPGSVLPPSIFRVNLPIPCNLLHADRVEQAPLSTASAPGPAPKVIVAIIDQGIPFAHRRFRVAGGAGTRFASVWVQSAPGGGTSPLFGAEFDGVAIARLIAEHGHDEEAIYRSAGLLGGPGVLPQPLSRAYSHGAHVLDTLAGGAPDDQAIIAVDLPSTSTWDTSGFGKDMFVLSAIHHIFDRAHRIAQAHGLDHELPLVLNLSYGISGGPHDGTGILEAAIDEMVEARTRLAPTLVTIPSGNSFQDRLFAHVHDRHFARRDDGRHTAEVCWFVPPDDRTSTYLEIWMPAGTGRDAVDIAVFPPGATAPANGQIQKVEQGFWETNLTGCDGKAIGQFGIDHHRQSRWRATVIVAPTDIPGAPPPGMAAAPAGIWTIRLTVDDPDGFPELSGRAGETIAAGFQFRIQRDESFGQGRTGARQSYFIDDADVPFAPDGAVSSRDSTTEGARLRRFGSLNGLATGQTPVIVGGHIARTGRPAGYSAACLAGPSAGGPAAWQPLERLVDLSAPSEGSPWSPGIVAAGTRSGLTLAQSGTSSAAPQVARLFSALLSTGAPAGGQGARAGLIATLGQAPGTTSVDPLSEDGLARCRQGTLRAGFSD